MSSGDEKDKEEDVKQWTGNQAFAALAIAGIIGYGLFNQIPEPKPANVKLLQDQEAARQRLKELTAPAPATPTPKPTPTPKKHHAILDRYPEHVIIYQLTDPVYGCSDYAVYEKTMDITIQDERLGKRYLASKIADGNCTIFRKNEYLINFEFGFLSVKVRRENETTAYWVARDFLKMIEK